MLLPADTSFIGDTLHYYSQVEAQSSGNNFVAIDIVNTIVTASFDPNDKTPITKSSISRS
ncbi:hypothetical protein BH09BAC1_BH09BAC1_25070 [soil metagenome]